MLKANNSLLGASVRVGTIFSKLGITPNQWTVISLLPAILGFVALVYNELLIGVGLFILSGLLDVVDGAVARVTGAVSNLGAFLDGIIDRYVELLMYMGVFVYLSNNLIYDILIPHSYWIALLIFGALMPTFVRSYADHRGVVTEPEDHKRMGGLIERAERLGMMFAGMILGAFDITYLIYMVVVTAVLSNFTALQRIWFVVAFANGERRQAAPPKKSQKTAKKR